MTTPHTTTPAARNYPLPQPENDKRFFTFGLLYEVTKAIEAQGYPPLTSRDMVELQAALFRVLYAPQPTEALMHLDELWAPACGAPHDEAVTSEPDAVTCPSCVELLPRRTEPDTDMDPADDAAIECGAQIDAAAESTGHLPGYYDANDAPHETRWLEPSFAPCPHCPCPTHVHSELGCVLCGCAWGQELQR